MTLLELKTQARSRANMENSTFISDTELKSLINNAYIELYDILVSRFEDYYSKKFSFTLAAGINSQALPADFYKVRGVDLAEDSQSYSSVRKWNFDMRNTLSRLARNSYSRSADSECYYRVMGQNIIFLPEDRDWGSFVLWYIPRYTPLALDTDVCGDVMDFHDYIIVDAAIRCLIKEESDVSVLMATKEAIRARVLSLASARDVEPDVISDTTRRFEDTHWEF